MRAPSGCPALALGLALSLSVIVTASMPARAATPAPAAPVPVRTFDDCDARVRAHPEDRMSYVCYAIIMRRSRQGAEAARRLRAMLAVDPENPSAKLALALVLIDTGDPVSAMPLLRESAERYDALGDPFGVVHARMSLARLLELQGSLGPAEHELDLAEQAALRTKDPIQRLRVLYGRAWHAQRSADYGRAWTLFKEVEAGSIPDGPPDLQAGVLNGLGAAAWPLQRYREALDYYRRAADYCRSRGDVFGEASNLFNIAFQSSSLLERGEIAPEEVDAAMRRALEAATATGNTMVEAAVRMLLGQFPPVPKDEQIAHLETSLALFRKNNDAGQTASALRFHARRLAEKDPRKNAARALSEVDEAIALARDRGDHWNLAEGWIAKSDLGWLMGERALAHDAAREALDAIERIRDLQPDAQVRADSFSPYGAFYRRYVGRLLAEGGAGPGDLDLALHVSERMRARVLLEALDAVKAPASTRPPGPSERRRAEVLSEVARVQKPLLDPDLPEAERVSALARLEALEREEASLRETIAREDPTFGGLLRPDIPSLAEVQAALGEDEALLSFTVSTRVVDARKWRDNGGSWVLVVTRGSARAVALPERDVLEREIGVYLGLFDRRDGLEETGSVRLYEDLLKEALAGLPPEIDELVVIPDEALHRLPFGALRAHAGAEPLAARYEIGIVPSATLWSRWRTAAAASAPVPVLAFADPPLGGGPSADPGPDGADARLRQARPWIEGLALGPLPGARAEAGYLVDRLGGESVLRAGEDASERFLKTADLSRYSLLHFAVHAVADDDRPDRSALVLAAGDAEEDGLVQIREIAGLDLRGRTIVLSACSSAGGRIVSGEGVVGLARGFFQAGARAVVASLWPLRDDEAERLVRDLTHHLADGRSVGAALSGASRDRMRAGDPPAAWAGLVILGDADHVPFPGGRARTLRQALGVLAPSRRPAVFVLVVGAALIGAGAGVLTLVQRRRRTSDSR